MIQIASSILSSDFLDLERDIKILDQSSIDYIHVDVMDGSFVPQITFGSNIVHAISQCTQKPIDVHLMINNPESKIMQFVESGANILTVHYESVIHLDRTLRMIKSQNVMAGISIVPSTHESCLEYILEIVDIILIMTVNPGFSGQKFLSSQLKKIETVRKMIDTVNPNIKLQVDGGINDKTARSVISAGADILVLGSYIFDKMKDSNNDSTTIKTISNCLQKLII